MTRQKLQDLTNNNVVFIEFIKKTNNNLRYMICTTCLPLLESQEGIVYLHYRKPKQSPPYNPLPDNVIVWDIVKQDFRQIPAPRVRVKTVIPWKQYLLNLKKNK